MSINDGRGLGRPMKLLIMAAALGEAAFGALIFVLPALALDLFFRSQPAAGAVIMTRIAGIALVGLGVACYPRGGRQSLYGLLTYSTLIMLYLIWLGIGGAAGVLLWPGVVAHASLSVLLIGLMRARR
jgi:hypothetical protein